MGTFFEAITIKLKTSGCTDPEAGNYNINAQVEDGSCLDVLLQECVESSLLSLSLEDADSLEADKALKLYAYFGAYKESLKEKNLVKIEMYKEKLADLCNCKTC
jgi:hypothetical protein